MKFSFTLKPSESKRLIAKAVLQMEEITRALQKSYLIIAGGTTNAFVAQEIMKSATPVPQFFGFGLSTCGVLCISNPEKRSDLPFILYKGNRVNQTVEETLQDFHQDTVIIKGANALDSSGKVGIVVSGFDGGIVGKTIGTATSQGIKYIVPVGLEKRVDCVEKATRAVGARDLDYSMGTDYGMYCLVKAHVVHEIEALRILWNLDATHVASGGFGGNEGAVTLVAEGSKENVEGAIALIKSIKGEPSIAPHKNECYSCDYKRCAFQGLNRKSLPSWLQE